MTDDLKALSDAATGGEWKEVPWAFANSAGDDENFVLFIQGEDEATVCVFEDADPYAEPMDANAELICTAINALRAGELVEADPLRELVARMRDRAKSFLRTGEVTKHMLVQEYANALAAIIGEEE